MSAHEEWLDRFRPALLEGDADAIAEIRRATLEAAGEPADPAAPVYLWNGVWVKGAGEASHEVPERVRAAFVRTPPPPGSPSAVWPDGLPRPADAGPDRPSEPSRREKLLSISLGAAEGDAAALSELAQRTRRHHEVVPSMFPETIEAHWFETGIMLLGPGDSPMVFQVPMSHVSDMIVPRAYPSLPLVRLPKRD